MVKLASPLALLAMALSVAAAPAAADASQSRGVSNAAFSFEAWVQDIIANPDKALTVDEALTAAGTARVNGTAGSRPKRDWLGDACYGGSKISRANGRDAAACVRDLALKGSRGVTCSIIDPDQPAVQFCKIGNAAIYGIRQVKPPRGVNCNDIAITAGKIFDQCWWPDDTVRGKQLCITNWGIDVIIDGTL